MFFILLAGCRRFNQNDTARDFSDIPEDNIRVAAVGDSITAEYFKEAGYPKYLAELLGDAYSVWNFGESNYAAQTMSDNPYKSTTSFEKSIEFSPEIVILMLGTNDTKALNWVNAEQFKEEYTELVENYLEIESVERLILAAPPTVFSERVILNAINPEYIDPIRSVVEEVAEEYALEYVDMTAKTTDYPEWFVDGIHPTTEGAAEIAQIFYEQIE